MIVRYRFIIVFFLNHICIFSEAYVKNIFYLIHHMCSPVLYNKSTNIYMYSIVYASCDFY